MTKHEAIDVFDYLDVRAFLRDTYEARKRRGPAFSYRAFSRRAGLASPNHLKRVIDGERSLTDAMAVRYAKALGLTGEAASYFCELAAFARAATSAQKNEVYRKLAAFRGYQRVHRLDGAHAAYHANWYVPTIRELANLPDFRPDPAWIAARLLPSITRAEAAEALATLFDLGMLVREPDGAVRPGDQVVSTGPETRGLHIGNYHRAMLERAAASIDVVPAPRRDISSLTFCTDEEGLRALKQRIQRFRQELVALLPEHEAQGDRVVQLNMQLFPLTHGTSEES